MQKTFKTREKVPASFRDPSGFLYLQNGEIYRQINLRYKEDYDYLISSGLYHKLVDSELLISHVEVEGDYPTSNEAYKLIKPEIVPFISYPYEWCFSQLKDAALTTLSIQKTALKFGMSLKDSSAYNIQFRNNKPILIDTLSFEKYHEGLPWVAYRQFCQHFLAPLALMSYVDVRLNQLFRVYIDGVPLDLASSLLPFRTRMKFSLLSHIHLHAKSQKHFGDKPVDINRHKMSRLALLGLVDNLEAIVKKLRWRAQGTEWAEYYTVTSYTAAALEDKKQIVAQYLDNMTPSPQTVWDLGANTGVFSRIAGKKSKPTLSFDVDPAAVERNYLDCKKEAESYILPLILDLTNPSPNIGWANQERLSLINRGPADAVLALALIHHLAISNNLPFGDIASFFNRICNWLIVEFVPKHDSQVQKLLSTREDIFPDYTQQNFEQEFKKFFKIQNAVKIKNSDRVLYLMTKL
ncbi:MAG: SAM-dependent methyltransferase [bacterium]